MNYEHIILSNFPSAIASLSAMNEKGEDITQREFRYTGFIHPKDYSVLLDNSIEKLGEFKHEVRQFEKSYDNQQAEQISLMV